MKMLNKKAQVGEGITWVFATIIIIIFLVVAILITDLLAREKEWTIKLREAFSLKEQPETIDKDFLFSKSVSSFFLVKSSGGTGIFSLKPLVIKHSQIAPTTLLWKKLTLANFSPIVQLATLLIDEEVNSQQNVQSDNLDALFDTIKSQANLGE